MRADVTSRFEKQVSKLNLESEWLSIEETIKAVAKSFGNSHKHEGLGIRQWHGKSNTYECRWAGADRGGLELRLVFELLPTKPKSLAFIFIGDHKAVKNFLR